MLSYKKHLLNAILLTLHDVVVPPVCKLPVSALVVQPTGVDLIRRHVLERDEPSQAFEELHVAGGAIHVGQDGCLVVCLFRATWGEERSSLGTLASEEVLAPRRNIWPL